MLVYLYSFFPDINWYSGIFYIIAILSYFTLISMMLAIKNRALAGAIILAENIFFILFLLQLQFTTIATIAATAGIMLAMYITTYYDSYKNRSYYIMAFILLLLSSLIRDSSFYLVLILSLPTMLFLIMKKKKNNKYFLSFCVLLFTAFFLAKIIHFNSYQSNKDWKNFMEFQKWRSQFHIYELYDYDTNRSVYSNIGWSKNDYMMFRTWFYNDKNLFTTNKIKYLISKIKYSSPNKEILHGTMKRLMSNIRSTFYFLTLYCLFLIITWRFMNKSHTSISAITNMIAVSIYVYFSYLGWFPERVSFSVIFCLFNLHALNILSNNSVSFSKQNMSNTILLSIYFLVCLSIFPTFVQLNKVNKLKISTLNKIFDELPSKNSIIIVWEKALPLEWTYVFDDFKKKRAINIAGMGWSQRTPTDSSLLEKFSVKEPPLDYFQKNDIYIAANPRYKSLLSQYMLDHYDKKVSYEVIGDFNKYGYPTQVLKVSISDDGVKKN